MLYSGECRTSLQLGKRARLTIPWEEWTMVEETKKSLKAGKSRVDAPKVEFVEDLAERRRRYSEATRHLRGSETTLKAK